MDPVIGFGMTDEERSVLSRYFSGRTLTEIPSSRAKRLVLLQRLALEFDVGRRYVEREVNEILFEFHPDWSALRRFLVDEGFLDREHIDDQNVYWRSGGRVRGSAAGLTRLPTLARMNPWETFRSVVSFRKFETDPVARRLRTAVTVEDLRRVAKRRSRGACSTTSTVPPRTSARWPTTRQRSPASSSSPTCCATSSAIDHSTTLLGRRIDMPLVIAPTGYAAHPQPGRAVGGAGGRAGRHPVLAVDHEHPVDRGGGGRQRRAEVVPGVHLERPRAGARPRRPGGRRPATRPSGSRSTRRCSAGAAPTPGAGSRSRHRSARARSSTASSIRHGRSTSSPTNRSRSPT